MSIQFLCEQCGHSIEVDDHHVGKHGKCKHCGHPLVVPTPQAVTADTPLRLAPIKGDELPGVSDHLLAAPSRLTVRPPEADPRPKVEAITDVEESPLPGRRKSTDYSVLDPHHMTETHSSVGPPPLWKIFPSVTARHLARYFLTMRNWLYVVSVFFLVVVLIGYLFQLKMLLHLGAVGVVASNISMLCVGVAYLVTLPFKESLAHGLANLFVPFYAIYYWSTRWPRMKTPVYKTVGSFLPIALVGLAYFIYEEAPVVEKAIEKRLPALEKRLEKLEDKTPALNKKLDEALEPSSK